MRRAVSALAAAALAAAVGCGGSVDSSSPDYVQAETWADGEWPLTEDGGLLSCSNEAVFITTGDGKKWPLNGLASSRHRQYGAEPEIEPIWRMNPSIEGARVNIGPLISRARELC